MKHKSYIFWLNVISIVLGVGLMIFLLIKPKENAPDPMPTEPIATESVPTDPNPTENDKIPFIGVPKQANYPKIDEIEYYFTDGTYKGQPAVLMGYKNNSQYTVTSVHLYFKMKADVTQAELSLFDPFVNSGDLTPEKLTALSPSFVSEIVCDPGETGDGSPCTLFYQTYATDVKQCQALTLNGAAITFLGNDGSIRTVAYSAKNNTHVLEAATKTAKKWSPNYFARATPMPNTRFITVNRNNNDYYQFTAYDMTYVQYQTYCSECYTAGFTNNCAVYDGSYTCTDIWGLTLNIAYHPEKQAVVVIATTDTEGINDPPKQTLEEYTASLAPALSDQVAQYVQADNSKSVVYKLGGQSPTAVPIWLPKLLPFSGDATACQADIEKDLERELKSIAQSSAGLYPSSILYITFDAYLNEDILSLIIKIQNEADYVTYHTYNFDVATGKRLTKEALIEKLQIANFDERLTQTAKNGFETKYGSEGNTDGFKSQQLNATMDPENLKKTQFYVDQDGKLMTVIYVHAIAGAAGYYELIPLS